MKNSLSEHLSREVTFIAPDGPLKIRMVDSMSDTISQAAASLNARYIVAAFDWDTTARCPVWGVYDMRKAITRVPGSGGQVSIPLPLKTFTTPKNDGAVMYALTLLRNK